MSPLIGMWASWTSSGGIHTVGQIVDTARGKYGFRVLVLVDNRLYDACTDSISVTKDCPSMNGPYR